MKLKLQFLIIILLLFSLSCSEKSVTPPDEERPPGYQEDIPWPSLAETPWPKHRHDPQNTGRSNYSGPKAGILNWEIDSSFYLYGELVLDEKNNLYVIDCVGDIVLYKFNPGGSPEWWIKYSYSQKVATTPLLTSLGNIVVADNRRIFSINQSGEVNWSFDTGNPLFLTGMNIDKEGNIYFTDAKGTLYSLNQNGNLNWTYTDNRFYSNEQVGIAFSPDGKTLYLPGWNISLFAFDVIGKEIKWSIDKGEVRSSPTIDSQGNIYIVARPEENDTLVFYSFDSNGNDRFSYKFTCKWGENWKIDPTIDRNGNLFFAGDSVYSLDYSGNLRWKLSLPGYNYSPLVNDKDGNVYLITHNHILLSISNNGIINWEFPFDSRGNSGYSPVIGSNNILFMNALSWGHPTIKSPILFAIK
jgi:hypothetical protein